MYCNRLSSRVLARWLKVHWQGEGEGWHGACRPGQGGCWGPERLYGVREGADS